MGTKLQPGKFDCYANAKPDEPMFILLARDAAAPGMVRRWAAHRAMDPDTPPAQVQEALQCAADMEAWREANIGGVRITFHELEQAPNPNEEVP